MPYFTQASEIRLGVIGYSPAYNMGRAHLQQGREAGMVPTAVADLNPDCLAQAEADFPGIKTYSDGNALIDDPDINLVILIIPHNLHAEFAIRALEAGKHVIVEKPFAITTEECDRMIESARKNERIVTAYHNRHWDGCILKARELVESGAIGDIVRIEAHMGNRGRPKEWWRSSKSISGGVLYDWGVHLLEYSLQLLNSEVLEVMGISWAGFWAEESVWKRDTNEDEAAAFVRMKSGAYINLRMTQIDSNPKEGQLEVTGTLGSLVFDQRSWTLYTGEDGVRTRTSGPNPEGRRELFYQNVADHLTKGSDLIISSEWSRRPIHIIDLAGKSSKSARALPAVYP